MAINYFLGTATPVAQVADSTITGYDAATTYTVTIGDVAISTVGTGGTANTTAIALVALLNASTHPYFAAVTWSAPGGGVIRGTADTAGSPFIAALTKNGGTGTVTDFSDTTPSSGPNHWDDATNWSLGAVPVNTNGVVITDTDVNICHGLSQSAVLLATMVTTKTYTGKIGLNRLAFTTDAAGDAASATAAIEYRQAALAIGITLGYLGQDFGAGAPLGSGRINLDLGTDASTIYIMGTANQPTETGKQAVRIKANKNTTVIHVVSAPGGVGIATDAPDDTTTIDKIYMDDRTGSSILTLGSGVTMATGVEQVGGNSVLQSAADVPSTILRGGNLLAVGAFKLTAATVSGGVLTSNNVAASGASIGTVAIYGDGILDLTQNSAPRTVTSPTVNGGEMRYDPNIIALTNPVASSAGALKVQLV